MTSSSAAMTEKAKFDAAIIIYPYLQKYWKKRKRNAGKDEAVPHADTHGGMMLVILLL